MASSKFIGLDDQWLNDAKQKIKVIQNRVKGAAASVLDGLDRSDTADIEVEIRMAQARAGASNGIDAEFMAYIDSYVAAYRRSLEDAQKSIVQLKNRPPERNATAQMKSQSWWPAHYKKVVDSWQEEIDHHENTVIPDLNNALKYAQEQKLKIKDTFKREISKSIQSIPTILNPNYDKVEATREQAKINELNMKAQDEEKMPPKVQHTMLGMYDDETAEHSSLTQSEKIRNERLARGVQVGDFLPEAPQGVSKENLPTYDNYWDQFYGTGTSGMGMGGGNTEGGADKGLFDDTPGAPDAEGTYYDPPTEDGKKEGDIITGLDGELYKWTKDEDGNLFWEKGGSDRDYLELGESPVGQEPDWWPYESSEGKPWFPTTPIKTLTGWSERFDWDTFLQVAEDFDPSYETTRGGYFQTRQRDLADAEQQHQYDLERMTYAEQLKAAYREPEAAPTTYTRENIDITGMPGVTVPAIVGSDGSIDTIDLPTLEQQIDRAILDGDMNLARAYTGIRNMPNAEKKLELMMQVAQSPADVFQLSNMAAGRGLERFGELAPAMRQAAMGVLSDPFEQAMAARQMQQQGQPGVPQFAAEVEGEPIPQQAPSPTPSAQGPTYGGTELQPGTVYRQDASGNIVPDVFSEYGGQDPDQNLSQQSPMNVSQGSGSYNTGTNLSGGGSQEWTDPRFDPRQFFADLLPTTSYGLQLMDHRIHIDPETGQPRHDPLSSFEGSELGFERPQSRDNFIQAYNSLLQNGVSPIDAARSLGMDDEQLSAFTRPDTQQVSGSPGNPFATGFGSGVGGTGDNSMIFPSGMTNLMSGKAPNLNPSSLLGSAGLPIPSMQQWGAFLPEERDVFKRYSQMQGLPEGVVDREIKSHTPGQKQRTSAARLGTNLGKY